MNSHYRSETWIDDAQCQARADRCKSATGVCCVYALARTLKIGSYNTPLAPLISGAYARITRSHRIAHRTGRIESFLTVCEASHVAKKSKHTKLLLLRGSW